MCILNFRSLIPILSIQDPFLGSLLLSSPHPELSKRIYTKFSISDSAEWYANEKEVGSAILSYLNQNTDAKREDIWFTTKLKENRGYDETRRKIRQSVEKSGLGYLDLYLLHSPYGGRAKRLECWRAVEDAVAEGEVRAGGVSNFGVKHVCIPFHLVWRAPFCCGVVTC